MKKIAKLMTVLAVAAFTLVSCEDVPSPFGTVAPPSTNGDDNNTELPYTSSNLNSGWTLEAISADQPWSQGSSYVQATGYQKWDGAEEKSNRAVEGRLISPAFSTKGYTNVKISFDHTIKYTNNVSGWEAYHKVYASSNYDEANPSAATWVEVTDFKPVASPYSDWTLYSSGELQLPAAMAGQDAIRIAFWFKAPSNASTTWELKNFTIAEGIAENNGGEDEPTTPGDIKGSGTESDPYSVADAIVKAEQSGVYVKAYIVGFVDGQVYAEGAKFSAAATGKTNVLIASTADETNAANCMPVQLPNGDIRTALNLQDNAGNYKKEVLLYGDITKYFGVPGLKNTSYAVIDGKTIGTKPGTTPGGGGDESGIKAVTIAEFNAAAESTDVWYKLTGTVKNLKDGDQYGNFDLEDNTGSVYVYGVLSEKGGAKKLFQELVTKYGIKEGSKITIIGNRGSYNNKIEVVNAYFVSIEGGDNGGNGGSTGADGSTVISIADFNAAAESTDVWYQLTGTVKNLKDGDLYGNFDLEDSTGSVYVYGVLSEKGGAKKLFQDLVTKYGIKNGTTLTIVGNRGSYNSKIEVLNAYFISASN